MLYIVQDEGETMMEMIESAMESSTDLKKPDRDPCMPDVDYVRRPIAPVFGAGVVRLSCVAGT